MRQLQDLLRHQGYTIKGVQNLLGNKDLLAKNKQNANPEPTGEPAAGSDTLSPHKRSELQALLEELEDIRTQARPTS